jgi:hypothetical protein
MTTRDVCATMVDMFVSIADEALRHGYTREHVQEIIAARIKLKLNPEITPEALAYCVIRIAETERLP